MLTTLTVHEIVIRGVGQCPSQNQILQYIHTGKCLNIDF